MLPAPPSAPRPAIFHRQALAREFVRKLLEPSPLEQGWQSGVFMSGVRRTGKTTFLLQDVIPELERRGAIVVYVDLWSDVTVDPALLVLGAIRTALAAMQRRDGLLRRAVRAVGRSQKSVKVAGILTLTFPVEAIGTPGGPTLGEALRQVVDQSKRDVVLIVDEVQRALDSDSGHQLMLALKSARDTINQRANTQGRFLFLGTGSHRALVNELAVRRKQAFVGAEQVSYPLLDKDYVAFVLQHLKAVHRRAPSLKAAFQAFRVLGHKPEEFLRALAVLSRHTAQLDESLQIIADTQRWNAAAIELNTVEALGLLAEEVFALVAESDEPTSGLYAAPALERYADSLGREVRADEVQQVVNQLLSSNLLMRVGHGLYDVTDPFIRDAWRDQRRNAAMYLPPPKGSAP